jgi:hypothetical protein
MPRTARKQFAGAPGTWRGNWDVDAGVKVSIFAGLGVFLTNRRMPIADLRMSKVRTVLPALSFDILRFGVLRFCGSVSGRRRRRPFSNRRKKNTFIAALTLGAMTEHGVGKGEGRSVRPRHSARAWRKRAELCRMKR